MRREDLRQLRQRVSVRLDIVPLRPPEVEQYMLHRWHQGGGNGNFPFNAEAVAMVASWSQGIPRVMNAICDIALLRAFTSETPSVGPETVREALGVLELIEPHHAAPEGPGMQPFEALHLPQAEEAEAMPLRRAAAPPEMEPRRPWWNSALQAGRRKV